jgi:tripartite-type tricarboxylate transporter receptor subunit TctC
MTTTRLLRVALGLALTLGVNGGLARAQVAGYPDRPIKILVGFGAGGGTDIVARILAQKMTDGLGQSVVVENRTGASGMIAAADVAKSPPDGYTLMMGSQTTFAVAPILYRKTVALDPAKDFAGVTLTGASPLVLVANPSFAAHSVADVIAMAKASPGKIIFGTGGVGTTPHMTAELFEHDAGIKMVHVPYRGEAPAINDTVAGQIPLMFANLSAVMGHIKGGTLRAIAVTGAQRSPTAHRDPHGGRDDAGFCGRNLVRHRRTGRNAARRAGKNQCRGATGARGRRYQAAPHPAWHEQRQFYSGRVRCLYQVRDRQMVERDQGRQHPGAELGTFLFGWKPATRRHPKAGVTEQNLRAGI